MPYFSLALKFGRVRLTRSSNNPGIGISVAVDFDGTLHTHKGPAYPRTRARGKSQCREINSHSPTFLASRTRRRSGTPTLITPWRPAMWGLPIDADPDREPTPWRPSTCTMNIRVQDPDHLLRREPAPRPVTLEDSSDDDVAPDRLIHIHEPAEDCIIRPDPFEERSDDEYCPMTRNTLRPHRALRFPPQACENQHQREDHQLRFVFIVVSWRHRL